jgi:sigma-B regulation protein RsbU (phosphoserine phosphatase)
MNRPLHILHLEDDPMDAELVQATLAGEGIDCEVRVVETRQDFIAAMEENEFDLVLADFALPAFDGMTALSIVRKKYPDLPFIFISGRLGEEAAIESLRNGATDYVLKNRLSRLAPAVTRALGEAAERSELKKAEEALKESEMREYQFQTELKYAAQIQEKLLPHSYPVIPGFDIAARCLPAKQVGGDFFDWQEISPGVLSLTLGDVMGKGIAAAILMATVRAAVRSVTQHNRPANALKMAEKAVLPDLENSESFVTLFHGRLNAAEHKLTFVDCGHGYAFIRRRNGEVDSLGPRGLPLGVPGQKIYQEGKIHFRKDDILVIYSDGLLDARPELEMNNRTLAGHLSGQASAAEMVDRLIGLTEMQGPRPDDITVLVARCIW